MTEIDLKSIHYYKIFSARKVHVSGLWLPQSSELEILHYG